MLSGLKFNQMVNQHQSTNGLLIDRKGIIFLPDNVFAFLLENVKPRHG